MLKKWDKSPEVPVWHIHLQFAYLVWGRLWPSPVEGEWTAAGRSRPRPVFRLGGRNDGEVGEGTSGSWGQYHIAERVARMCAAFKTGLEGQVLARRGPFERWLSRVDASAFRTTRLHRIGQEPCHPRLSPNGGSAPFGE